MKTIFLILVLLLIVVIYYIEIRLGKKVSWRRHVQYQARNMSDASLKEKLSSLRSKSSISEEEEIAMEEYEMEQKHRNDLRRRT